MKRFRSIAILTGIAALALPASSLGAGLLQASTSPGSASGSPLDLPGLLTLGKSSTSSSSSNGNVASAAGLDLLTKSGNVGGPASNGGTLAPVGDLVDQVNTGLCPGGPVQEDGLCVVALYSGGSGTSSSNSLGTQETRNNSYTTAAITLGDQGVYLLGSAASSTKQTPTGGSSTCTDLAGSYILTTKGPIPGIPNNALSKNSTSLGQPC